MGYRTTSIGELTNWWGYGISTSEVYVFRAHLSGINLRDAFGVLPFVRAIGKGQNLELDVRGAALTDYGSGEWDIDVVMTSHRSDIIINPTGVDGFTEAIASDPEIRQMAPGLKVTKGYLGQLTAPKDAIDHWRSQPILWDHTLSDRGERGGPTDTFASPVPYSIVLGTADDGKRAKPWTKTNPGLGPSVVEPVSKSNSVLLIAGLVVMVGVIGLGFSKGKRK